MRKFLDKNIQWMASAGLGILFAVQDGPSWFTMVCWFMAGIELRDSVKDHYD